ERINRSIQAEGEFSKLKEALGYKRFNHKGLKNVVTEISIMAIAMNLNTLTNKIYDKDYGPTRYQISEEKIA
ncbi:transposase, partial [Helcococcus ovis]|uniref:transposase n=2 Tax=Peptoniphilaceae TaxID=1570339 RepID=UPI0038B76D31